MIGVWLKRRACSTSPCWTPLLLLWLVYGWREKHVARHPVGHLCYCYDWWMLEESSM